MMISSERSKIIFVIGVSGCGKSTIGKLLAKEMHYDFFDADDYHPVSNIEKMNLGKPLNDLDRLPWLDRLNKIAIESKESGCVIACSALKVLYRERLLYAIQHKVIWVYLKGAYKLIYKRMQERKDHFMDANMLRTQFDVLEEPIDAIEMNITESPEIIVSKILKELE